MHGIQLYALANCLSQLSSWLDPIVVAIAQHQKRVTAVNEGYTPADLVAPNVPRSSEDRVLRAEAAGALEQMSAAAELEVGEPLQLTSGYRTFAYQQSLYDGYVAKNGAAEADTYSARPGYSEHQTGLAADLTQRLIQNESFRNWQAITAVIVSGCVLRGRL